MAVIMTRSETLGNVLKWTAFPQEDYHFEQVTVNVAGAGTLACGTVQAKVTATGKYLVQDASLASGAGLEAAGVLIGDDLITAGSVVAAATDKKVLMLARGPAKVAKQQLVMGAGTDTQAEKDAVYAALATLGILASEQI